MNLAYIKFNSRKDQVCGFYELATKAKVISFSNDLYSVPLKSLELLDTQNISYRRATDQEVNEANGQIRNPVALVLF